MEHIKLSTNYAFRNGKWWYSTKMAKHIHILSRLSRLFRRWHFVRRPYKWPAMHIPRFCTSNFVLCSFWIIWYFFGENFWLQNPLEMPHNAIKSSAPQRSKKRNTILHRRATLQIQMASNKQPISPAYSTIRLLFVIELLRPRIMQNNKRKGGSRRATDEQKKKPPNCSLVLFVENWF